MDISKRRLVNLALLMEELGITRKQVAATLGKAEGQVNHWFMDPERDGYRGIGKRVARQIDDAYNKPRGWLDEPHQGNNLLGEPGADYQVPRVPIIGFAIATPTEDGYFDDMGFPPGMGEAYLAWPTRDRNAYALRVRGDSMAPRIRAGEVIVIEPGTTPGPGDDVLVKTRNGRKMVKELLYQRAGMVTFGSINQAYRPVTISMEDIEAIEFIAGRARGAVTEEKS